MAANEQGGTDYILSETGQLERLYKGVKYAHPTDAAQLAKELSDAYLSCRERTHDFQPHTVDWLTDETCYERNLMCSRCQTIKRQYISYYGAVLQQYYLYPDDYLAIGLGRIVGAGRDAVRLESVRREIESGRSRR